MTLIQTTQTTPQVGPVARAAANDAAAHATFAAILLGAVEEGLPTGQVAGAAPRLPTGDGSGECPAEAPSDTPVIADSPDPLPLAWFPDVGLPIGSETDPEAIPMTNPWAGPATTTSAPTADAAASAATPGTPETVSARGSASTSATQQTVPGAMATVPGTAAEGFAGAAPTVPAATADLPPAAGRPALPSNTGTVPSPATPPSGSLPVAAADGEAAPLLVAPSSSALEASASAQATEASSATGAHRSHPAAPPVATVPDSSTAVSPVTTRMPTSADPIQAAAGPAPSALPVPVPVPVPTVASVQAPAPVAAPLSPPVPVQPLSAQLGSPLFSLAAARPGEHVMTVQVTPENLGPVTVRAVITGDDVRIEMFSPSETGREALRQILTELRRDLAVGGLAATLDLSSKNHPESGEEFRGDADEPDAAAPAPAATAPDVPNAAPPTSRSLLATTVLDITV